MSAWRIASQRSLTFAAGTAFTSAGPLMDMRSNITQFSFYW